MLIFILIMDKSSKTISIIIPQEYCKSRLNYCYCSFTIAPCYRRYNHGYDGCYYLAMVLLLPWLLLHYHGYYHVTYAKFT